MALEKDNILYYKIRFQELLKDAENNGIDIGFHIKEVTIENKATKEKVSVRDKKLKDYEYIRR